MITRRDLIKAGGLTLCIVLTPKGYKVLKAQELPKRYAPNLWMILSRENYLTVFVNKSEMGQGVYTGLAMLVAEELDFPWDRVKVRAAPAGRAYVDPKMGIQLTGGSTSLRNMYEVLRLAGASMREMVLTSASKSLKIPKEKLEAKGGF
ncbi:MAG: molybdopterin cofactor-binding domain-containing protein, partial [Sulfurihydrogenibium azorense]